MSARDPEPCDAALGEHGGRTRFYHNGWKCDRHSPWAMKRLKEPKPTASPAASSLPPSPISASHIYDERAIASGKRRSNPHTYRAAKDAVNHRKEHPST